VLELGYYWRALRALQASSYLSNLTDYLTTRLKLLGSKWTHLAKPLTMKNMKNHVRNLITGTSTIVPEERPDLLRRSQASDINILVLKSFKVLDAKANQQIFMVNVN
jgi:hypothetical protein